MDTIKLDDFNQVLPEKMSVSVIMEKTPSTHQWINFTYQAVGVVCVDAQSERSVTRIHQNKGVEQYLFTGLSLQLFNDECESYYHKLMSPQPGCFIVAGEVDDPDDMPTPYLVSLSFDEVHAYLEGDEQVYAVEIPAELYKWSEAFILTHYAPTKKTKRALTDWKADAKGNIKTHGTVS